MAQTEYNVKVSESGPSKTKEGITKNDNIIFDLSGIEEPDSNFNEHRREIIKYTIEKNLSIAIANYNDYSGTQGLDFRMPEFSEEEWDRIQQNMTVISYLQGLPIGTKIYNGVSVVANNVNKEVVSEQSIYIGDGGNTTAPNDPGNNYYPVTYIDYDSISNPVGIYNVDLQRRQVEYNKKVYYYYPKLYFNVYSPERQTVNLNADYNGNLYKYLDKITSLTEPNNSGTKLAQAFYTALGRERESRYNQRNNYEELLTMMSDEEAELVDFNAQFTKYEGEQSGSKILDLIEFAKNNNSQHSTDEEKEMRVNVREGPKPIYSIYFDDEANNILSDTGAAFLDGDPFMYNGSWYNTGSNPNTYRSVSYVVPKSQDGGNSPDSYQGPYSSSRIDPNKKYNVNLFYYNGRIKGIYVMQII